MKSVRKTGAMSNVNAEQRRHARRRTIIEGAFYEPPQRAGGRLVVTDVSRSGFRASLTRPVSRGTTLQFGVQFPDRLLPQFFRGHVIWSRQRTMPGTFTVDVGVKLADSDILLRPDIAPAGFGGWFFALIAEHAMWRGIHARQMPRTYFAVPFILPGFLVAYIVIGAIVADLVPLTAPWYGVSLAGYAVFLLSLGFRSTPALRNAATPLHALVIGLLLSVNAAVAQICFGIFFIWGMVRQTPAP